MADFVSGFWSWYIGIITVVSIAACYFLVRWMEKDPSPTEQPETMGHVWDGDLQEYNNPLPSWWKNLFYITLVFSVGYLVLYPGLGSFQGILGWSEESNYEQEINRAENLYGPIYEQYRNESLRALGAVPAAMKIGERLFMTYCTGCHGSDAGGVPGFPSLRDNDWLWGGEPEAIKQTIVGGRTGAMPPWQAALGDDGLDDMVAYVLSLGERKADPAKVAAGKEKFAMLCIGCHGPDGKGNQALGAPNLTDNIWLYGGSPKTIRKTIAEGRTGKMPAHGEFLGEAKSHLLAAYILQLSGE